MANVMGQRMVIRERAAFPQLGAEDWPLHLFEHLITRLVAQGSSGAVYAELGARNKPVEINYCSERELMLTKKNASQVIGRLDLAKFTKFLTYLIREVLGLKSGAVAAGVIDVEFVGEGERHFAISARRSSSLGSYFQIDQFASHL